MNKNKCALEKKIDHSKVPELHRNTCLNCLLFEKKGAMSSLGICCAVCCIRINSILSRMREPAYIPPGTPSDMIPDKIAEHKENIVCALPDYLREYYKTIPEVSKKSWQEIAEECGRCYINREQGSYGLNQEIKPQGDAQPMKPIKT